ncbi:hypothetical protein ACFV0C_28015 [Streptomyces sp. NPDC059568]|uniref:hypothetical protein n=1 Tax=Streptomyces sp. NPDC059568 TaxID=3346868 RepID=UPI00369C8840
MLWRGRVGLWIALLTNGGRVLELWRTLVNEIASAVGGPREPDLPEAPAEPVQHDLTDWYGTYDSYATTFELTPGPDGEPTVSISMKQDFHKENFDAPPVQPVTAVDPGRGLYVAPLSPGLPPIPLVTFVLEDGSRYLHFGARAIRKSG